MSTEPGRLEGQSEEDVLIEGLRQEKGWLDQKIVKLSQLIFSPGFYRWQGSGKTATLMRKQLKVMQEYSEILAERIERGYL